MMISFEKDLQKLGLSEKESKVYLASLELGPSPVQDIAGAAKVNRATTYVMIESLKERGLMSSSIRGKKVYFHAEPPKHLLHIVEKESEKVKDKQNLLEGLLPKLGSIVSSLQEHPRISLFEGVEGLREVHEDIIDHCAVNGAIENIAAVDDAREFVLFEDMNTQWEKMAKKKIRVRAIYTKKGLEEKIPKQFVHLWEEKRISEKTFPFHGEIAIYGDRVAFFTYKGKIISAIIESEVIAQTIRTLFELAWTKEN